MGGNGAGGSEAGSTRVLVVDDSEVVRLKLRTLIAAEQGLELVGEAADGAGGVELCGEREPDVVVMDLGMPGMSGIEATWKLGSVAPSSEVLVLTVSEEQADIADAIMAGAKGYVVKGAPDDEILEAVRRVARGERAVTPQLAAELVDRTTPHPAPPPPRVRDVRAVGALRAMVAPAQLLQTLPIAIVAGLLLTAVNQGAEIAEGTVSDETWIKAALNVLIVFAVVNLGVLAGRLAGFRAGPPRGPVSRC